VNSRARGGFGQTDKRRARQLQTRDQAQRRLAL